MNNFNVDKFDFDKIDFEKYGIDKEAFIRRLKKYESIDFDKIENISCSFMLVEGLIFLVGDFMILSIKYFYWGIIGIALSWVVEFIRRMVIKKYYK